MGALVADIAAAFVLLVAGGCARAVAQPLWRRFVHWWHTEGNEPAEFRFMERLVESMVAKPRGWHHCRRTNKWVQWCASQKVCPDCGQRLPKHGEDEEGGPPRTVAKAAENMRKAEEEVKQKVEKQYTGTKNAGKVPTIETTRVFGKPCPELDEEFRNIWETTASIEEAQERLRKAEEELIRARLEE